MGEPVLHQGQWWFQHENGAWTRWDSATQAWVPYRAAYYTPVYSSIAGLGRWVMILIGLDMVISFVMAMIGLDQITNARALSGEPFPGSNPEEFFREIAADMTTYSLLSAVWQISGIVFAIWFYRAYQNLPALRTTGRYATGWAIGAWLVPILNLFRPKQIADDIWRSSDPTLPENPGNLWLAGKVAPLLHWWWAVWIGASFVPLLLMPFMFAGLDSNNPEAFFARFFGLSMAGSGLGRLIAGAFAIPVVKQMTERQERRAADLGVLPREA